MYLPLSCLSEAEGAGEDPSPRRRCKSPRSQAAPRLLEQQGQCGGHADAVVGTQGRAAGFNPPSSMYVWIGSLSKSNRVAEFFSHTISDVALQDDGRFARPFCPGGLRIVTLLSRLSQPPGRGLPRMRATTRLFFPPF